MKERNTLLILLITTIMVFGYHLSKEKQVKSPVSLLKQHHSDLTMEMQKTKTGDEATLKDWDHLFDKIIETNTIKNSKKPVL